MIRIDNKNNNGAVMDFDIEYLVIQLHAVARQVEQRVGFGDLSKDIRKCADRLSDLNKGEVCQRT